MNHIFRLNLDDYRMMLAMLAKLGYLCFNFLSAVIAPPLLRDNFVFRNTYLLINIFWFQTPSLLSCKHGFNSVRWVSSWSSPRIGDRSHYVRVEVASCTVVHLCNILSTVRPGLVSCTIWADLVRWVSGGISLRIGRRVTFCTVEVASCTVAYLC